MIFCRFVAKSLLDRFVYKKSIFQNLQPKITHDCLVITKVELKVRKKT